MLDRVGSIIFVSLMVLTLSASARAQRIFTGEVVDIIDGRTVVLSISTGKINAELQFIDVPVEGQVMSGIVRDHLRSLVMGKTVEYRPRNILRDRTIGKMTMNNVDVSQQMLRDGAAWHMPVRLSGQDEADFQVYASTEAVAKNEKRGVWGVPELKPSWEQLKTSSDGSPTQSRQVATSAPKKRDGWGDKNPRLSNIGPLMNGYNARTRSGYLSTSLLGVDMRDAPQFDGKLALEVTYYYRENDGKARSGVYFLTIACVSQKLHFAKDNELWLYMGEKKLGLGRPVRQVDNDGVNNTELMKYKVSRETLDKLVNNDRAFLKLGQNMIIFDGVRYMLYNMLQVAN